MSFACQVFDPASCTVCITRCPSCTTLCAETICFYVPVAQLYVGPCLMCHLPLHSHVQYRDPAARNVPMQSKGGDVVSFIACCDESFHEQVGKLA